MTIDMHNDLQDPVVPGVVESAMGPSPSDNAKRWGAFKYALLIVIAVVTIMGIGFALAYTSLSEKVDSANSKADAAATGELQNKAVADKLAQQLQENGISPSASATAVPTASPGPPGPSGPAGLSGRGITATLISQNGHLIVQYSDGTQADVGLVVGPTGEAGASGTPGQTGATGPAGQNGSNGTNGRGVTGTVIADGHLIVSFSDGTSSDVGQVVGTNGAAGAPGAAGVAGSPPGSIVIIIPGPLANTTETCDPPSGSAGPGSQPTYTCR